MPTTVERIMVDVQANTARARAEMSKLDRNVSSTTSSSNKRLAGLARGMGLAFGGVAVVGAIGKTISLAMDFDKTMRTVGVQTDTSGKKLERLGTIAKQMGQATIYSAQDAGNAMLNLAKGGLTAADIKGGALKQTLTLAAAGGLDLADAANAVARGMGTFGLKAGQASQITTALAGGANASTAEVSDLTQALQQVGPGARQAGLTIQDTVAALSEFDKAGVRGSDAGTSLKTMLQRLIPVTGKQAKAMHDNNLNFVKANGNFHSLGNIAQQLRDHLGKLGDAQRSQALTTIFGSDASRAAAILMEGGRKTLDKYKKATLDQSKAQQMANVAMGGASGAWENFKGTIETTAISIGQKLLPMVTKTLNWGNDFLNSANKWGPGVAHDFDGVVSAAKSLFGVVTPLARVVVDLAKGFQSLPGPVKSTAVEVALAALIFPRLSAAAVTTGATVGTSFTTMTAKLAQFRAELTYSATRGQALMGAMKGMAGPAGMGLMIASTQMANKKLSALSGIAGGALMGFAVAGPWGAAVGGGAVAIGKLASATGGLGDRMRAMHKAEEAARGGQLNLRQALDQTTGAMTAQARQTVSQDLYSQGMTKSIARLGLTQRDVVSAILGQKDAYDKVTAAVKRYQNVGGANASTAQNALSDAAVNIGAYLGGASAKFRKARDEIQKVAAGTQTWGQALKHLPKSVRVNVKTLNARSSLHDIAAVAKQAHLTPKQIKTVIKAIGAAASVKDVERVKASMDRLGRTKADIRAYTSGLHKAAANAAKQAKSDADAAARNLQAGPKGARADLSGYTSSIRNGTGAAKSAGSAGGRGVGAALKAGVLAGFSGTQAELSSMAASAVRGAIASAKAAAKIKSPSQRMRDEVGLQLTKGITQGLKDGTPQTAAEAAAATAAAIKAAKAKAKAAHQKLVQTGKSLIQSLMSGIRQSKGDADRTLRSIGKWAAKTFDGAQQKRWAQRVREATHQVNRDYERLAKTTKALSDAQAHLSSLRGQRSTYESNIRGGMTSQASITNAGADAKSIAKNLATQATKVKRFAMMLNKLRKRGWADQILRDIAAAGVEGGYDTAKALLSASSSEEASINRSYRSIYKTAKNSAKTMGDAMYGSGIRAAEGVVKGLKDKQRAIKDLLMKIADHMANAIRAAVGLPKKHHHRAGGGNGGGGGGHSSGIGVGSGGGAPRGRPIRTGNTNVVTRRPKYGHVHFHFQTYYPRPESLSKTTNNALQRAAALSLI